MKILGLIILFFAMIPFSLSAKQPLAVGDSVPPVTVTTHLGEQLDMGTLYAKGPVVVYFYPKSFTGGCTKQACNLRDNYGDLKAEGITVVGVSIDTVKKQKEFTDDYDLPFILIADEDKVLGKSFQAGTLLNLVYKRQTFLVVDGKIAWRDLKAKPTTQSDDILKALKSVSGE